MEMPNWKYLTTQRFPADRGFVRVGVSQRTIGNLRNKRVHSLVVVMVNLEAKLERMTTFIKGFFLCMVWQVGLYDSNIFTAIVRIKY